MDLTLAENSPPRDANEQPVVVAAKPLTPKSSAPSPVNLGQQQRPSPAVSAARPPSPARAARAPTPTSAARSASRTLRPSPGSLDAASSSASKTGRPATPTQRDRQNVLVRLTLTKEEQKAQRAALEAEKIRQELAGCTFSPNIKSARKTTSTKKVHETLAKTPVRDHALYDEKKKQSDLKDCTFMPNRVRVDSTDVHERLFEDAKARANGKRLSGESDQSVESLREGETPALAKLRRQEEKKQLSARKP